MGFYRIHMLDVIAIDFLIVPIIMTGGGVLTIVIFLTGMTAIIKEDTSWLITFSILTILNFFVLLTGVISSIRFVEYLKYAVLIIQWFRLVVEIQIGFLNAEVIPELSRYETEEWVQWVIIWFYTNICLILSFRYKWDTIQSEFMCCGGYGHHQVC